MRGESIQLIHNLGLFRKFHSKIKVAKRTGCGREEIAVANMLFGPETVEIFQFLIYSGSGNIAYRKIYDSHDTTKYNEPNLPVRSPNLSQHEISVEKA